MIAYVCFGKKLDFALGDFCLGVTRTFWLGGNVGNRDGSASHAKAPMTPLGLQLPIKPMRWQAGT